MAANGQILDFRRGSAAVVSDYSTEKVACDWSAASDPGSDRNHNEDAWRVAPDSGVFALADGMGGYNAGDVAAQLALDRLLDVLTEGDADETEHLGGPRAAPGPGDDRADTLRRAVGSANAGILAAAARRHECLGMATTLACAWVGARRLTLAHVGNSRIYLLRGARFSQLTQDHTVAERGGALTRVLGIEPAVEVEVRHIDWFNGDRLLICSDGLHQSIGEATIVDCVSGADRAGLCVDALLAAALASGCRDNVTALAVFLSRHPVQA